MPKKKVSEEGAQLKDQLKTLSSGELNALNRCCRRLQGVFSKGLRETERLYAAVQEQKKKGK